MSADPDPPVRLTGFSRVRWQAAAGETPAAYPAVLGDHASAFC
jgi:hypothetical protein